MPESHAASGFVKLFPADDIPRILQNLQTVCSTLVRNTPFEKENDLTKRLFQQLCRFREYRDGPIEPHWESFVVVVDDDEPDITGRVDIKFSCGRGIETYFPVEAKRLFVTYPKGGKAPLITDYINDGMRRYLTGQYGSKMTLGAMLGYVCDNTVPDTAIALKEAIALNAARLGVAIDGGWKESRLEIIPPVDETRHELNHTEFTIYHILSKV